MVTASNGFVTFLCASILSYLYLIIDKCLFVVVAVLVTSRNAENF